jgi:signal transduction histidine kinase
MLETNLDVIHSAIVNAMMTENKDVQHIIESLLSENIIGLRFFDDSGIIKYSSDTSEVGKNIILIPAHKKLDLQEKNIILYRDQEMYSGIVPIRNEKQCQSCHHTGQNIGYIDMDFQLSEAEVNFYTGVRHTLFLSIALIIFLVAGLYFIFNRFINRPLQNVIGALSEVEKGNLTIRQEIKNEDEFGLLNMHFNNMVEQLDKSLKEIDQFHFKQLQRADKLVTLGELAAEMAHEINNPTGVIMTRADFLKLEADEYDTLRKYKDDINVIINQAEKIAQITKSVLKYSKKRQQEFENMNLYDVIETSLSLFAPSLEKRNIAVNNNLIDSGNCKDPVIYGNPQQIEQVITNILNNSIDALGSAGTISIDIRCVKNSYVELKIKDDGPGIDPEVKEQIFLPFFTTKSDKNGTGLGLYIVSNICQHHNAEIFCDSVPGQGTTFTIHFNQVSN